MSQITNRGWDGSRAINGSRAIFNELFRQYRMRYVNCH